MRLMPVIATACLLNLAVFAVLPAQSPGPAPANVVARAHPAPYLESAQIPDVADLLGPPPADGSGTKAGDVATFRATRRLQGSSRWTLPPATMSTGPGPCCAISPAPWA
jgi:hypothetical protein